MPQNAQNRLHRLIKGLPVASGRTINPGDIVLRNDTTGYCSEGRIVTGHTGVGWCANSAPVDNSAGGDGDKTVDVWQGDVTLDNATTGTAVGPTGLAGPVYADGRQSVTVSSAGRSKAGVGIGLAAGNLGGVMTNIESKGA
jgi:hypothetical protein